MLLKFAELHPGVSLTVKVSDYLEDNFKKLSQGEIDFLLELDEERTFPEYLKNGELKELNVSDIDIKLNVYYLCSKERRINPVMKEFIRMAKEL